MLFTLYYKTREEDTMYCPQCTASDGIFCTGGHVIVSDETHLNYQKSSQSCISGYVLFMFPCPLDSPLVLFCHNNNLDYNPHDHLY